MVAGLAIAFGLAPAAKGEGTNAAPPLTEVYDLVRAHLAGVNETELNRTAVQALISALSPKVTLVTDAPAAKGTDTSLMLSRSSVFFDEIVYLRVARVGEGLAQAVHGAFDSLASTNKIKGLVLDLRFADGGDYAAATAVADLFLKADRPLLDWGQGTARAKEKKEAVIKAPVAVLVNRQTIRAAEALAGILREAGVGLVLGNRTAGEAMITQDFTLKDGQRLRIATAPVRLGDGTTLAGQGIKPDIAVDVTPQEERLYFADAFAEINRAGLAAGTPLSTNAVSGTNRATRRPRYNEAELVRERKEGLNPDIEPPQVREKDKESEPEQAAVQDPALARALDLLKGLAVVRRSHS